MAAKKPKAEKAPKTRCSGTMTESAFLAWIRSALRSKSLRWTPRTDAIVLSRREYVGPNKRQKWECQCAICKQWFMQAEIVVDHYPKPAGSILSIDDVSEFVNNLYCEVDNLRVLCKPCHDVHTLAEAQGITFAEAVVEKKIIAVCNKKVTDLLDFLASYGHTGASVSNADKRKALVSIIIKGEST